MGDNMLALEGEHGTRCRVGGLVSVGWNRPYGSCNSIAVTPELTHGARLPVVVLVGGCWDVE